MARLHLATTHRVQRRWLAEGFFGFEGFEGLANIPHMERLGSDWLTLCYCGWILRICDGEDDSVQVFHVFFCTSSVLVSSRLGRGEGSVPARSPGSRSAVHFATISELLSEQTG